MNWRNRNAQECAMRLPESQRDNPICHGRKLSTMQTRTDKFVSFILQDLLPSKQIIESNGLMHRLFSDDRYMDSRAHLRPTLLNGNRLMMLGFKISD